MITKIRSYDGSSRGPYASHNGQQKAILQDARIFTREKQPEAKKSQLNPQEPHTPLHHRLIFVAALAAKWQKQRTPTSYQGKSVYPPRITPQRATASTTK